jgi:hypothetical protein
MTDTEREYETLPLVATGVVGDSEVLIRTGWCAPSQFLYEILGPPPTFWQDKDDGLLCWLPLEGPTQLFDDLAMRHNASILGRRRGRNPIDDPPVEITAKRGGIQFGGGS